MRDTIMNSIVDKVKDIKVLPGVLTRIMEVTENPDSNVYDMEKIILSDQALTTKVLRLANSAYYGYGRKISTISQATLLLGFKTIKSMAIAATVSPMMKDELKGYALDSNDLWMQSQTCAIISRHIAKKSGKYDPEEAYVAGLLRDIGKTILNEYMVDEYIKVVDLIMDERYSFSDAEKMIFDFNHAELGAKIAEKWNLPGHLVEAIKYHHNPDRSDAKGKDRILLSIVHIADAMTMMMGVGLGVDGLSYTLSDDSLELLEIDGNDFSQIISDVSELIKDRESFFLDN